MSTVSAVRQCARMKLSRMQPGTIVNIASFTPPNHDTVRRLLAELEEQGYLVLDYTGRAGRKFYRVTREVPSSPNPQPLFDPLLRIFGYARAHKPKPDAGYVHRCNWA